MPEASNPSGKSQVVGYCHIKPDLDTGKINIEGASFFWDDGHLGQRTGFASTLVYGIQENDETICNIHFDINENDRLKRHYSHGILQFQFAPNSVGDTGKDVYAGYLRSYKKETELQNLVVHARGYAEWHKNGCVVENDIKSVIERNGNLLFANFNAISNAMPLPSLWTAQRLMPSEKSNIWKHDIPTPQSVILNEKLLPFIERYLSRVLSLFGLDDSAIKKFQTLAIQTARKEQDDTLVAYERKLKAGLIGMKARGKEDEALTQRAEIIYSEIKDFFVGESLLDIGCGNGMISSLATKYFKRERIQLLDIPGISWLPKRSI